MDCSLISVSECVNDALGGYYNNIFRLLVTIIFLTRMLKQFLIVHICDNHVLLAWVYHNSPLPSYDSRAVCICEQHCSISRCTNKGKYIFSHIIYLTLLALLQKYSK